MNLFSLNWWISTLIQTFIVMCMFYILKWASSKFRIPVVSDVIEAA